jgi:hypothetical protein
MHKALAKRGDSGPARPGGARIIAFTCARTTLKEAQTGADATYPLLRNDQRMTAVRQDVGQLTVGDVLLEWLKKPAAPSKWPHGLSNTSAR